MAIAVGRVDDIIAQLERLYQDANGIFDAYIEERRFQSPVISFGVLKAREIAEPAGSSMNYLAALKLLRGKFAEQKDSAA
jgi:hypothetical protein